MGGLTASWIALAHVVEPGDPRIGKLVQRHGPQAVLTMIENRHRSIPEPVSRRYESLLECGTHQVWTADALAVGARIITREDREWPTQIDDLGARTPFALWVVGAPHVRLSLLTSVAIVGARASTPYGEEIARRWSAELADRGVTVVSGGAFGIDAAAHRGALMGGLTVCVVAGGVNVVYPRAHESLLARIADDGLIISESPPGQAVQRQRFLTRNRMIAALTKVTVVVEAAERSGTASIAREAHDLNRPVAAAPGPITSASSAGCHRLIRDHEAVLASSVADIVELLGESAMDVPSPIQRHPEMDEREKLVLAALSARRSVTLDALVRTSGLNVAEVSTALGALDAAARVAHDGQGWRLVT